MSESAKLTPKEFQEKRKANLRWQKRNRTKANYYSRKSNAKRFIKKDIQLKDIPQFRQWLDEREAKLRDGE